MYTQYQVLLTNAVGNHNLAAPQVGLVTGHRRDNMTQRDRRLCTCLDLREKSHVHMKEEPSFGNRSICLWSVTELLCIFRLVQAGTGELSRSIHGQGSARASFRAVLDSAVDLLI